MIIPNIRVLCTGRGLKKTEKLSEYNFKEGNFISDVLSYNSEVFFTVHFMAGKYLKLLLEISFEDNEK